MVKLLQIDQLQFQKIIIKFIYKEKNIKESLLYRRINNLFDIISVKYQILIKYCLIIIINLIIK